jgi:hypothetical protein
VDGWGVDAVMVVGSGVAFGGLAVIDQRVDGETVHSTS